ncbi:MAG: T9SS type A sorting domain-containing protein [Bacteroidales bacterium]|nr:T9SS type A sorting domain-containing protein [Bacteroidales bacterium]
MKNFVKYLSAFCFVALPLCSFGQQDRTETPGTAAVYDEDFRIVNQYCNRPYAELYPNPLVGNTLKIKTSGIIKSVEIKNIIGQCIVAQVNKYSISDDMVLTFDKKEPGIYSAKITFEDNNVVIKKLIIR